MRKVQLLLVCLMLSAAAFAADKVIKLPKPNLNRTGAVMKALSERHSTREYASKALSLADLSDLLWAANGINRKESGMRTAPSALNKQDVDVYVVLPEGSYLYDAKKSSVDTDSCGRLSWCSSWWSGVCENSSGIIGFNQRSFAVWRCQKSTQSVDGGYGCRYCFPKIFQSFVLLLTWQQYHVLRWTMSS